jgi:serine/threonine protein kinase
MTPPGTTAVYNRATPVALAVGTRIGSYEVVSRLGAGGMGEVYRAHDASLKRDVALKLLPETSATDAERTARFTREAQTLAALNHPNIAQVFAVERHEGSAVIVMELVDGEDLASRLERGALPLDEAIGIARQIAEALEAAHELSIVHRDLKPANIRIRPDGVVKVLDFGLAKTMTAGTLPPALQHLTTLTSPAVTTAGVVLGTAAYMAPEQASGRMVDKRADIWAFGAVLFEMLTGRRIFGGQTVTETIAAVMKDPIPFDQLPATTSSRLRQLIARCLDRDPRTRLRDIGEARIALSRVDEPRDAVPQVARRSPGRVLLLGLGVLSVAVAAGAAGWLSRPGSPPAPVRRFELPAAMAESSSLSFSPDGTRIAYSRANRLFVHSLATGEATDLGAVPPTTEDLFWSHDSQTIGFGAESTLRTIPAAGGTPFVVCRVPASGRILGGLWLPDNTILFSVWRDSVYRVRATGGVPEVHVALDAEKEVDVHSLSITPGNRLLLSVHLRGALDESRLDVVENGQRTPLLTDGDLLLPRFVPPNHLLFVRRQTNAGVWVAPFDRGPIDLAKASMVIPGAAEFEAAREGTVVARFPPKRRHDLVWVKRDGTTAALPGTAFEMIFGAFGLSPDGRRALLSSRGPGFTQEILVRDLATGTDTRVPPPRPVSLMTTGAVASWAPGGRLFYVIGGVETSEIFDWPADGSNGGRMLVAGTTARVVEGRRELYFTRDERGMLRLRRAVLQPDGSVGTPEPVFAGSAEPDVRWFDVSPDGRLLAFTDTAGDSLSNIFVATLPDLRERRQVTSSGGTQPKFSPHGRHLFYLSGSATGSSTRPQINSVSVSLNPLSVDAPSVVLAESPEQGLSFATFDVSADGRLLMGKKADPLPGDEARMVLIEHGLPALKK